MRLCRRWLLPVVLALALALALAGGVQAARRLDDAYLEARFKKGTAPREWCSLVLWRGDVYVCGEPAK